MDPRMNRRKKEDGMPLKKHRNGRKMERNRKRKKRWIGQPNSIRQLLIQLNLHKEKPQKNKMKIKTENKERKKGMKMENGRL